ncbi:hypothetical protein GCM10009843_01170 [Nocardioides bigeumensis]|uniref:Amidohydrolase-related domain-containing protein n=1 Tax=Nocardioides bigeumensis TaxID=433657 RepID=A0ABN2XKV0_9ACTN
MSRRVTGLVPGVGVASADLEDGRIAAVEVLTPVPDEGWRDLAAGHPVLVPGLLDLQVNGYAGVDFSSPGLDPGVVRRVVEALWAEGVTGFCPTVITGPAAQMRESVAALAAAARADEAVADALLGVHLEGPWISPVDGARGAHPVEHVRPPDAGELAELCAAGDVALLTIAPEIPGATGLATAARERGVLVSVGHSLAEPEDVHAAVAAGATLSTHLGNGIPALLKRHPNLVWEQLGNDVLTAMFIADGHHVDLATLRTMIRAKGAGRWFLVSDTTSVGGLAPGRYRTHIGGEVELDAAGRLGMIGTDYLAGAAASLRSGLANAWAARVAEAAEVTAAVSARPAAVLGERAFGRGGLDPGARADLLLGDWDEATGSLTVKETVVRGRTVWAAS